MKSSYIVAALLLDTSDYENNRDGFEIRPRWFKVEIEETMSGFMLTKGVLFY